MSAYLDVGCQEGESIHHIGTRSCMGWHTHTWLIVHASHSQSIVLPPRHNDIYRTIPQTWPRLNDMTETRLQVSYHKSNMTATRWHVSYNTLNLTTTIWHVSYDVWNVSATRCHLSYDTSNLIAMIAMLSSIKKLKTFPVLGINYMKNEHTLKLHIIYHTHTHTWNQRNLGTTI